MKIVQRDQMVTKLFGLDCCTSATEINDASWEEENLNLRVDNTALEVEEYSA